MSKREIILSVLVAIALGVFGFVFFREGDSGYIKVVSPDISDKWQIGQAYKIKWIGEGKMVSIFLISKSLESTGASVAITWRVDGMPNTGSYNFLVPMETEPGLYKISVSSDVSGSSSEYFEIVR